MDLLALLFRQKIWLYPVQSLEHSFVLLVQTATLCLVAGNAENCGHRTSNHSFRGLRPVATVRDRDVSCTGE
jgi:hypothetical protein